MATIQLKQLKKSYGKSAVIHGIDLHINEGEFIVIVGPSGCGKSTALRMLAGLETISSGEIYINDRLVNQLEPKDRNIAMVFQNYALYPHMTVYKNIAYGLKVRGIAKKEISERVEQVAQTLELKEVLQRKPFELSGGQRQRVAMGRAMVRKPDVFLFDEPLSNLDAKLRVQMRLEIRKLHQKLKTTSIYVTHDQVEAMTLADRIVVMNNGKAEQIGSPLDIYHCPASVFVADFIGSPNMNFIPAQVNEQGDAVYIFGKIKLPLANSIPKIANQSITVGIRPEDIITKNLEHADRFTMQVSTIEMLGSDNLLYGEIDNTQQHIVARLPSSFQSNIGETVSLGVLPEKLHLFDTHTQLRINRDS